MWSWIFAPSPWSDRVLGIVRIVAALMFMSYGSMKLFGYPASPVPMPPMAPFSQFWFAGVLEVFGGALILLGLLTRPVAFILAGEMAVAYFQAHAPRSFWPSINQGSPAILYCFFYLYLSFHGAGGWSVDRLIARSRRAPVR